MQRAERFIADWEEFSGQKADSGSESPSGIVKRTMLADAVPKKPKNPKKEEVAEAAIEIMREKGRPMTRDELFEALPLKGIRIHGKNPPVVLQTMLWRMQERIVHLKGYGYWPADDDYDKADYDAEDDAELRQEVDEEEFDAEIQKLV